METESVEESVALVSVKPQSRVSGNDHKPDDIDDLIGDQDAETLPITDPAFPARIRC